MNTCLGIHVGHDSVTVALAGAEGGVLDCKGPELSAGVPLAALSRLLVTMDVDIGAVDRALSTGIGSGLVADTLGIAEAGVAAAAARFAGALARGARSVMVVDSEDALLATVADIGAIDVRHAGPCGMGVGRLLARWAPDGAPGEHLPEGATVSAACAEAADEGLSRLRLGGAGAKVVAAHAVRAGAAILAGTLLKGRGIEGPVALVGPGAGTGGLARELDRALGLPADSVMVPGRAEQAVAIGAALLAPVSGGRAVVPAEWPPAPTEATTSTGDTETQMASPGGEARPTAFGVHVTPAGARAVGLDPGGHVVSWARATLGEGGAPAAAFSALGESGWAEGDGPVGVTGEAAAPVAASIGTDVVRVTRATALARYAKTEGAPIALHVGPRESVLVWPAADGATTEVDYPPSCGLGLGRALEDVAGVLGLADAGALGRLAAGSKRGAWLRDRCAGTIRRDAATSIASGASPEDVARGALEAVARAARRRLAGRWPPGDGGRGRRMLLTGELAHVPGLAEAVARSFGTEAAPARDIPGVERALAIGAALESVSESRMSAGHGQPGPDGLAELEQLARDHMSRRAPGGRLARMGLPLSLMDGERAVYWSRFLTELDFEVVLADPDAAPSPRARAAGEPCGPAAALVGEVAALAEQGVDAVFVPVEVDADTETEAEASGSGIVYRCPFLQAGAHLVPPGIVRVVRPVRFGALPGHLALASLIDSLFPWRISRGAVRSALAKADAARLRYRRDLTAGAEAFLEGLVDDARAVVLLGREYGTRLLPAEARNALIEDGVALLPQEFLLAGLPPDDKDVAAAAREMHWESGRRILAAARKVARGGRLAAVQVTHARCGPDSFISKYLREILAGRPWARIELSPEDAKRSPERVAERCRVFRCAWDSRVAAGAKPEKPDFPEHPEPARREGPPPCIRFPDMGVAADAGVAALEGFGIPAEVVRADEESLRAAAPLTSGDECLPYIVTIGNLAKTVADEGFDPARSAFFMATSSGACRFGQYRRGFRQVLDALGHDDVRVISLNQSEGKTKQMPGAAFGILLWKGIAALGALDEVGLHVRPRARDPETAERAIRESREDVLESLRARKNPREALERSAIRMRKIEIDPGRLPVRVALTGEIFVRSQPFSNSQVVRTIENAGGEVVAPPFQEWLHHVSRCIWLFARARGDGLAQLKVRLARGFLRRGEERARRTLKKAGAPVPPEQPAIEEVWRESRAAGFVPWFGDASLALGRAIALGRRGAKGVVNIVPYGCLPGTVSESVFASRTEVLGGMPVLNLSLDGGPAAEVRAQVMDLVEAARHHSGRPPAVAKKKQRFIRPSIRRFWVRD